ncbi:MAG: DUF6382 domain-containing protein [Eubacteriales bacterium]|nr:DUF6382 domain-containing protein [Eubacteriales bacterium]MDD4389623.1 DUF6382 domain-containing protein [Eubacteriales bacterium]
MSNTFAIELKKGILKEYEKEILLSNQMNFLLPMGIVEKDGTDRIIYDYTNFEPIYKMNGPLGVKSVLDILEKTIISLIAAEDYLLDAGKVALSCSTVYTDSRTRNVRLMYFPSKGDNSNICENISAFAKELSGKYVSGIAAEYLSAVESYTANNTSLLGLANKIAAMRREAFICGIQ